MKSKHLANNISIRQLADLSLEKDARSLLREKYNSILTPQAQLDIDKLKQGQHVDYLIGFVNFLGCKIDLSFRPLIPRPETEYWVGQAIKEINLQQSTYNQQPENRKKLVKCLDLFAGSGCVGVAVLMHVPFAHVDFADNDRRCLKQISKNLVLNSIDKIRVHIIKSDLFSGVKGQYDYILANPPYLATTRKQDVQKSVLQNEPEGALFAGSDGLDVIKTFLAQAKHHLTKQGTIYLEFDSFQKNKISRLITQEGYSDRKFFNDQFGQARYVITK